MRPMRTHPANFTDLSKEVENAERDVRNIQALYMQVVKEYTGSAYDILLKH